MTARSSLWPVSQRPAREQRRGRYLPESLQHPAKMFPALAQRAVETYTRPGDLVADPMCGVGTTLVEAAHLGRDGFGVEYEARWAELARANLAFARARGATGDAEVVVGDCRDLRALAPPDLAGRIALVLTSPPYGPSTHGQVDCDKDRVRKWGDRYSADRSNLAYTGLPALLAGVETMLRAVGGVLAPQGTVVLTARPWRHNGALIDLPGAVVRAASGAGFVLAERNVALLTGLRDGRLVPRASFFQLNNVRDARAHGLPHLVIAHEDVLVFRRRGL